LNFREVLVNRLLVNFWFTGKLICNGPNEHYSEYTPLCPPNCENEITCQDLIDKPSCQCKSGYVRNNYTGICVKCLKCNRNHEHYSPGTPVCPKTCANGITCDSIIDKPSCECDDGYARNKNTGKCVKCLKCNGKNEHYSDYTPLCPPNCNNITCDALIDKPSCQCDTGFVRNERGTCQKCTID
jgi:hypothetical protein